MDIERFNDLEGIVSVIKPLLSKYIENYFFLENDYNNIARLVANKCSEMSLLEIRNYVESFLESNSKNKQIQDLYDYFIYKLRPGKKI